MKRACRLLQLGDGETPKLKKLYELDCRKKATGAMVPKSWGKAIRTSRDAAVAFHEFKEGSEQESLMAVYLDGRHKPIGFSELARGAANVVHVSPRDLFRQALGVGASALIMSHNHPSGDPSPSPEDQALTERIRSAGEVVGVAMLDHLVVGDKDFYSFQEGRLLPRPFNPPDTSYLKGARINRRLRRARKGW